MILKFMVIVGRVRSKNFRMFMDIETTEFCVFCIRSINLNFVNLFSITMLLFQTI